LLGLQLLLYVYRIEMALEPSLQRIELKWNVFQWWPTGISIMRITDEKRMAVP
jgi:hypothetical protein